MQPADGLTPGSPQSSNVPVAGGRARTVREVRAEIAAALGGRGGELSPEARHHVTSNLRMAQTVVVTARSHARRARPASSPCGGRRHHARSSLGGRRRPRGRRVASRSAGGGSSGDPDSDEPGESARRAEDDHVERPVRQVVLA
jgi:hypothetical protein